ncbi:MAG: ParB/RepB/Spo0J family partition protein [Candidatus Margulisbacteria bacterium]|nr:ParB/RepB/Spo0J family partition protein [Candidatus Margulisiibacteriota bacterium]
MATIKRGLGKGLSALLPAKSTLASGKTVINISPYEVKPNPRQPRHTFEENSLRELAASIKEHGVVQPLVVRLIDNKYELVAGERRLRAAKIAELETIPVIVKNISNEKSLELAIIENIQRENLNALDEAEAYSLLMKEFGLTQERVSNQVGKSRSAVANSLRLLELPKEIKNSLRKEEITAGHARAILAVNDVNKQLQMWKEILKGGLNVRNAEEIAVVKKGGKKEPKEKNEKLSPIMSEVRDKLSSFFGTKVNINGTEGKGKLEIIYYNKEDLERIIEVTQK